MKPSLVLLSFQGMAPTKGLLIVRAKVTPSQMVRLRSYYWLPVIANRKKYKIEEIEHHIFLSNPIQSTEIGLRLRECK